MVIAETIIPTRRVSLNSSEIRSKQAEVGSADDGRISSVVVIRTLKGSLGTGFYITPDTVITNYHVIEGNQVVELNRNGGQKFVGRVFKTDIGLDLALIKVPELGKPVQFANSSLVTGTTVEAIGHPSGLEFTLTRGIVSAVRKMKNPLVRGSSDMLVIQTDAAISPGNSGGPLFVGNQVVGVNSQKLVRTGVEGIGFAVHYAEVQRFIQEP
jgi:S1-C subfamily serine protease